MVVATWWIAGTVTINGAAGSEDVGKGGERRVQIEAKQRSDTCIEEG